jgi:hypothetical protein
MSQTKPTQYEYDADAKWEFVARVETEPLEELLKAADELVSECRLHIGKERVWLNVVDPANVAMIQASAECVIDADGETVFGVATGEFIDELDEFDNFADRATLCLIPGEKTLVIRNDYDSREVMAFDPETAREEPEPPELEYPNSVTVEAFRFIGALEGIAGISDGPVMVKPYDGFIRFSASPSYVDTEWTHEWDVEADASEGPEGVFSDYFLRAIVRGLPPHGTVALSFGGQIPMRIDNGEGFWYMIAPRIADYPEPSDV